MTRFFAHTLVLLLLATQGAFAQGSITLKRAARIQKETRLLLPALIKSGDPDEGRTYLQGWLARRAEMIVAFLDAWEIEHQGGIVEDFSWVEALTASMRRTSEIISPIADGSPRNKRALDAGTAATVTLDGA